MTKTWLPGMRLGRLIGHANRVSSRRKMRLFALASCGRFLHLLHDPRSREALAAAEQFADGLCDEAELAAHYEYVRSAHEAARERCRWWIVHTPDADCFMASAVEWAVNPDYIPTFTDDSPCYRAVRDAIFAVGRRALETTNDCGQEVRAEEAELLAQTHLFHDLFGNLLRRSTQPRGTWRLLRDTILSPFLPPSADPITADPSWLTSTVVALAEGIYQERAFDRLPILADALMDAGCENADVLDHCRGAGPHVRGCWVIDLMLGKE